MARFASLAEKYRHHRKCFELGLALGITPKEAESMIERVQARKAHRALCRRYGQESALPPLELPRSRADFERWDAPWMSRD